MLDPAPVLDPDAAEPLWLQIARLIERDIAGGVLAGGARLPSERVLTERLGVSRVTLRRALGHLVDEGVLESARGRGWFVTTGVLGEPPNALRSFAEIASARGLEASARVRATAVRPATIDEAEDLAIAPGAPILQLDRLRLLGGAAVAVDRARVRLDLAPGLEDVDFTRASLYAELERRGTQLRRADYAVEARAADADVAALLDVPAGFPLLVTTQTTFDQRDRPVELATMAYRGDRYRFRASLHRAAISQGKEHA